MIVHTVRMMHSAKLESSPRLQRVHDLLKDGAEYSTMEIVLRATVCAVNSIISELRDQGAVIDCRMVTKDGTRVWLYRMRVPVASKAEDEEIQTSTFEDWREHLRREE